MNDRRKTKAQLVDELGHLRCQVAELSGGNAEGGAVTDQQALTRTLTERVKELRCLYAISRLREEKGVSLDRTLQGIVDLIPSAWQYPEIACARLVLPQGVHVTSNFRETTCRMQCSIRANSEVIGTLEVSYLENRPEFGTHPFLEEERHLLSAIAERIQSVVELNLETKRIQEQQEHLLRLDKMIALGTLVSGVAHEINNPNNFIMLNAPMLLEAWKGAMPILDAYCRDNGNVVLGGVPYPEMRDDLTRLFEGMLDGAKRIRSIVNELKGFARSNPTDLRDDVDLNAALQSAIALIRSQITRSTEEFSVDLAAGLPRIRGNSQRLQQVMVNLLQNACESLPDKTSGIFVSTHHDRTREELIAVVRDQGTGIRPEQLHSIIDPFFTTKRDIGGTGLGLSVSSTIVKNHGGTLTFASTPSEGTTVELRLPVPSPRSSKHA